MPKSKMYNFSREEIKLAIDSSQTFKECLEKLGYQGYKNITTLKKVIDEWYDVQCKHYFDDIGNKVYHLFEERIKKCPEFTYKKSIISIDNLQEFLYNVCNVIKKRRFL